MGRRSRKPTAARAAAATPGDGFAALQSGTDRWKVLGICLFLAAITWVVFGQTLRHEFINFDDGDYVYENPKVARGLTLDGLAWCFTHLHAANWHPVTWLSHMLDCQLYGLSPGGHHFTNVVIHAATVILLFCVLRRMTGALWPSAFVAAVFAIHPLRVESVAWIAERKDMLSGLFFMLTIAAYVRYTRRSSIWSYGLLLLAFALGLMSKPMLVTVPFVLLLLDYWPLNRLTPVGAKNVPSRRQLILEKLPLLVLVIASCVLTLLAQKVAIQPLTHLPIMTRIGNSVMSYAVYLRQMLWPFDLAPYYPLRAEDIAVSNVFFSFLLLGAISVIVFIYRRHGYLVTGWLWYIGMLAPVIGILQVGNQAHADRYTYLPQIGLSLALTWGVRDWFAHRQYGRPVLGAFSAVILTVFALAARTQAGYWKDSESLWRYALSRTSNNAMAELNFGEAVHKKGRVDEAISHLTKAVEIQPGNATNHGSLGIALLTKGRRDQALTHLRASLSLNPNQAPIHSSLGVALLELGQPEESAVHLRKAVEIDPDNGDAHYNLGNTLLQMGQAREAVAAYERAANLNPKDMQTLNNLAWVLATWPDALIRDGAKAVELAERADSLAQHRSPVISCTLAAAYAEVGRSSDAVKTAQHALQLATSEGNVSRVDSIRIQIDLYQSGAAFRDSRFISSPR